MKNTPIFISIDGHGGSGKSTFAQALSHVLSAEVIHIDDFTGLNAPDTWYKSLVSAVIEPALNGISTLSYKRAQWWAEHHPSPVVDQPVTQIMIIEGVGSSRRELRSYIAVKVFVDTPRSICIKRGLERDSGMGGKSDTEIVEQWNQWLEWDDQYFLKDDPKNSADIIVDGTKSFNQTILELKLILEERIDG